MMTPRQARVRLWHVLWWGVGLCVLGAIFLAAGSSFDANDYCDVTGDCGGGVSIGEVLPVALPLLSAGSAAIAFSLVGLAVMLGVHASRAYTPHQEPTKSVEV